MDGSRPGVAVAVASDSSWRATELSEDLLGDSGELICQQGGSELPEEELGTQGREPCPKDSDRRARRRRVRWTWVVAAVRTWRGDARRPTDASPVGQCPHATYLIGGCTWTGENPHCGSIMSSRMTSSISPMRWRLWAGSRQARALPQAKSLIGLTLSVILVHGAAPDQ